MYLPSPSDPICTSLSSVGNCVSVFAKCNSAAAAVNMLLACFCGFVAHHKSENPPHSLLVFVSVSFCICEFRTVSVCGFARVSPKDYH